MPAPLSPPPRPSAWEWGQTALIAITLAWTTLCFGGYRPETMVVTVALNTLMLGRHFGRRAVGGARGQGFHPAGWWLMPFLVYAAANAQWITPVRWLGWHDWLGWAQMIAVFWVVVNDVRTRAARAALLGALLAVAMVGVVMACYQRFVRPDWVMLGVKQLEQYLTRSSGSFAAPNSFAGLLLLLIPAALLPVWRRRAGAVARLGFGYIAAVLLLLTLSRGAWLALALALTVWPLCIAGLGWRRRLAILGGVVAVAVGAIGTLYTVVPTARQRIDRLWMDRGEFTRPIMWRAAWSIWRTHPVLGGGAGSFAPLFEPYRAEIEQKDPQWAHNDYLNTLSDYGLVGVGLFFGACGAIVVQSTRRGRQTRRDNRASQTQRRDWEGVDSRALARALGIGLLAFGLHLVVDFHLKIPALAMTAAAVAGLALGRVWPADESAERAQAVPSEARWSRVACGLAAVVCVAGGVNWALPHYRAEAVRRVARAGIDDLADVDPASAKMGEVATTARDAFSRAVEIDPANAQAWADRAYTAAILGHETPARQKELGAFAEADARRALALTGAVPEYWVRLGVALDMQGRWLEAGGAFAEALRLAPVKGLMWFHLAYHLSLDARSWPLARAAIATCLRLDGGRREAEILRQRLATGR